MVSFFVPSDLGLVIDGYCVCIRVEYDQKTGVSNLRYRSTMMTGRHRAVTKVLLATTTTLCSILFTSVPVVLLAVQPPCPVSCFVVVAGSSNVPIHHSIMRNRHSQPSASRRRPPLVPVVAAGGVASPAAAAAVMFDNGPSLRFQIIVLTANALGYVISLLFRGLHLHVDLLGTGAFALGALPGLLSSLKSSKNAAAAASASIAARRTRIQWSSIAVIAWSIRLAGFLFYRIISSSTRHDARLDAILMDPVYAAGFWVYSALWGISCALPYSLGLTSSSGAGHPVALYSGMTLFGIGWLVECLADYQKYMFKRSSSGPGGAAFCNVGLWSISQHPNWFGNLLLWAGIFVMNAPALVDPVVSSSGTAASSLWTKIMSYRRIALALIGPAFMLNLFYSQATGKLMADVFAANREKYGYGTNAAFTEYIDS
jgi:steroid 5-alpha reductase family enzyme